MSTGIGWGFSLSSGTGSSTTSTLLPIFNWPGRAPQQNNASASAQSPGTPESDQDQERMSDNSAQQNDDSSTIASNPSQVRREGFVPPPPPPPSVRALVWSNQPVRSSRHDAGASVASWATTLPQAPTLHATNILTRPTGVGGGHFHLLFHMLTLVSQKKEGLPIHYWSQV